MCPTTPTPNSIGLFQAVTSASVTDAVLAGDACWLLAAIGDLCGVSKEVVHQAASNDCPMTFALLEKECTRR